MDRVNLAFILALWAGLCGNLYALNDPTQPTDPALYFGTGQDRKSNGWSLQSILTSPDRRIAIINGSRVREGDRIGSARVVRIRDSHVLLNTGGRTVTLRLLPQSIKVRP
jgi:MSHA biogenesis protein MshK